MKSQKLPLVIKQLFVLTLILTLFSCKKTTEDTKVTGGKLQGTIQAWDDKLSYNLDPSGITVSTINNTAYRATTDANGKFTFENLPFDNYDLLISKSGYGSKKIYGVAHAATANSSDTSIPLIGFGKLSTTTVTSFSVIGNTFSGEPGVSFNITFSPVPSSTSRSFVRYFFHTSSDVSNSKYTAASDLKTYSSNNSFAGFTASDLVGMGFTSGQTVHVKAYGDSFQSNDYNDPSLGKKVFPNLNTTTTAAVSFIVP